MSAYTTTKSSRLINALPFFYGWIIVIAGTLGIIMIGPSQTFTVGVFLDSFIGELGISRANISLIYGLSTLVASFMLPLAGRWLDRYGARRMALLATVGLGLACLAMSRVQGVVTIFLGLLALRFLGFGALQMASNNVIAQWFIRQRGLVMGLAGQSLAISLLIYPPLAEYLIGRFGWRDAWIVLGGLAWLVMLPVSWLFFKDKPELYGLQPDGDSLAQTGGRLVQVSEINWTLAEARRTGAFWIFAAALSTITMITAGLIFHQSSLFEVRGLDRSTAISAFNIVALFSIISNLGMGYLLDRFSARLLLSLTLLLLVAMMILVQVMSSPVHAFIYSALTGLVTGSYRVMDAVVWAKYYGRQHLGTIKGATMLGVIGATALGPYPLGLSFDYFGSYGPVLTGLLVLPLGISVLALFVKRPQKPAG
jgi:MFS family permease